jgi:hypothetical protein
MRALAAYPIYIYLFGSVEILSKLQIQSLV